MSSRIQRRADRELDRIARAPLRGAWTAVATVTVAVTVVGGVLMRVTDPHTFPNVWLGLWWAVQTVTTVGYGDVVPISVLGRVIGTIVMIGGIGFITVSTAAIASAFVEAGRRRRVGVAEDKHGAQMQELRDQLAALTAEVRASRPAAPPDGTGAHDGVS